MELSVFGTILQHQVCTNLDIRTIERYIQDKLEYVRSLKTREIAIETDKANAQHYEVDTDFMLSCLGKRAKYSCCLFERGNETLDQAEGECSGAGATW